MQTFLLITLEAVIFPVIAWCYVLSQTLSLPSRRGYDPLTGVSEIDV